VIVGRKDEHTEFCTLCYSIEEKSRENRLLIYCA
jgi:hypothetical protein